MSRRQIIILILNGAALLAACIIAMQTVYILTNSHGGHPVPAGPIWRTFVPPIVMFIINNARFSLFFLVLHLTVVASLSNDCWLIHVGTPPHYDNKGFGEEMRQLLIALLSIACFGIYLFVKFIKGIISISHMEQRDP
jgi:hypothetical protein